MRRIIKKLMPAVLSTLLIANSVVGLVSAEQTAAPEETMVADETALAFEPVQGEVIEEGEAAEFGAISGHGTSASPFVIENASDLVDFAISWNDESVRDNLKGIIHVQLVANIDLGSNPLFEPIGEHGQRTAFDGVFNGNGYTIKNSTKSIFGYVSNAKISNLKLDYVTATDSSTMTVIPEGLGLLAYSASGSTISDILVTNAGTQVDSGAPVDYAGGLVGVATGTTFENCIINDPSFVVVNEAGVAGGFVGKMGGGSIKLSAVNAPLGSVNSETGISGGLVGTTDTGAVITQSFADIGVNTENANPSDTTAGGLVGFARDTTIRACYTKGAVEAVLDHIDEGIGGIVGVAVKTSIEYVYTTMDIGHGKGLGTVSSLGAVGGIAGRLDTDSKIANSVVLSENFAVDATLVDDNFVATASPVRFASTYQVGRIAGDSVGATTNNYASTYFDVFAGGAATSQGYAPEFMQYLGGGQVNGQDGRSIIFKQGLASSPVDYDFIADKTLWIKAGFDKVAEWTVKDNPNTGALELPIITGIAVQSGDMPGHLKTGLTMDSNGFLLISTIGDLIYLSENMVQYSNSPNPTGSHTKIKLVDDIDMSLVDWADYTMFTAVNAAGTPADPKVYLDEFDGNGHTLYGYNSIEGGLFSRLENCLVYDLSMEVDTVLGANDFVGILADDATRVDVTNVRIFNNDLTEEDFGISASGGPLFSGAGNLFGRATLSTMTGIQIDLARYSKVLSGVDFVGGIVGLMHTSTIKDSYACIGEVNATSANASSGTGGLVGSMVGGSLEKVYAKTWDVTGTFNVGGLVGFVEDGQGTAPTANNKVVIKNAYSLNMTRIQGDTAVGGLIGTITGIEEHSVENVYAASPKIIATNTAGTGTFAGGVIGSIITNGTQIGSFKVTKAVALVNTLVVDQALSKIPMTSPAGNGGRVIGGIDSAVPTNVVLTDLFAWKGMKMGGTSTLLVEKPMVLDSVGADDLRVATNMIDGEDLSYDDVNDAEVWGVTPTITGKPEVGFPSSDWNIASNVLPTLKSTNKGMADQWNQVPSYIYPDELKQAADGAYVISSIPELYVFRNDINGQDGDTAAADYAKANIRLTADLDFNLLPDKSWMESINSDDFTGRTDGASNFMGTFDGNGYTITLFEDDLFGYLTGATIKNLNMDILRDPLISQGANINVPALVGKAEDGVTISNCKVVTDEFPPLLESGTGATYEQIYGLIAKELITSTIENSRVDVFGSNSLSDQISHMEIVGGMVGQAVRSDIIGSIANVIIDGSTCGSTTRMPGSLQATKSYIGGLVGEAIQSNIERSYTTGVVISGDFSLAGGSYAGGIVGSMDDTTIKNSYSRVNVSGRNAVGGVVGFVKGTSSSNIDTTYATGSIYSKGYAGGIVGQIDGSRPQINNSVAMNSRITTTHTDPESADRVLGNRSDGNYNRIINNFAWDGMDVFYDTVIAKTIRTETEKTGIGTNLKTLMSTVFWREAGFEEAIWSDVNGDPYLPILNLAADEESLFPWPMYLRYLGAEESQDVEIVGTPKVGNTLVATLRGELVGKTVTYQWYINSKAVTGATGHTFVIPATAKVGDQITVIVVEGNSKYAARPVTVISETEQIEDFVTRLYDKVFDRLPDPEGFAFWVRGLVNKTVTAAQMVDFFVISAPEMAQKNLNNTDYLEILYAAIFGRDADAEGLAFWTYYLENGCGRRGIALQFLRSKEFADMCADYKVNRGDIPAPNPIDVNLDRTVFIFRQYKEILNRTADFDGLTFWAEKINSGTSTIEEVSKELIFSNEFQNRNTTDDQYLTVLYAAFFDRTPDAGGMQSWKDAMNGGMSREEVLNGFVYSTEFTNLKAKYNL